MIVFYILVVVLVLVGVAVVLPPLLRQPKLKYEGNQRESQNVLAARDRLAALARDHAQKRIDDAEYQSARADVEKNLALDLADADSASDGVTPAPIMAVIVALALPIFAGLVYFMIGTPSAIVPAPSQMANEAPATAEDVEQMVASLADRLENEEPDNVEGWFRLAQSYLVMGRFDQAIDAAERVRELSDDDPAAQLLYASAVSASSGGTIDDATRDLVMDVVKLQPDNPQALWMAGMAARQRDDAATALEYWRRLLPLLSEQPEQQADLQTIISDAEAELAGPAAAAGADTAAVGADSAAVGDDSAAVGDDSAAVGDDSAGGAETATAVDTTLPASDAGAAITVNVRIDDALRDQAKPADTVFVFARALDGPPMPLAVVKTTVSELPITVELTDGAAMMPTMTLSKFDEVTVGARVSATGDAIGQSGDLEGIVTPVANDADAPIDVVIDSVRD